MTDSTVNPRCSAGEFAALRPLEVEMPGCSQVVPTPPKTWMALSATRTDDSVQWATAMPAVAAASERVIGSFQSVKHLLASMVTDVERSAR